MKDLHDDYLKVRKWRTKMSRLWIRMAHLSHRDRGWKSLSIYFGHKWTFRRREKNGNNILPGVGVKVHTTGVNIGVSISPTFYLAVEQRKQPWEPIGVPKLLANGSRKLPSLRQITTHSHSTPDADDADSGSQRSFIRICENSRV